MSTFSRVREYATSDILGEITLHNFFFFSLRHAFFARSDPGHPSRSARFLMQFESLPISTELFCLFGLADEGRVPLLIHWRFATHEDEGVIHEGTEETSSDICYPRAPKPIL